MDTGAMKGLVACWLFLCLSSRSIEGSIYGEVVLSDGSYGAVQIYLGESTGWASVCYDGFWADLEARVVCHQLGYENGSALAYIYPSWEYVPDLHLFQVECNEYDFSLIACRFNTTYSTCSSDPAFAGVQCVSAGWSSSFYIGIIVMIFVLAACFSFFIRIFCGSKERAGIGQWSWYRTRLQRRNSSNRLVSSSGGTARCEDEESLFHELEDPKLTQPAPPSYSDAIELAQIPPPCYSSEIEGRHQDNAAASQPEPASSSFDLNDCSPPAYASVVASDSLPPSSSSVTNV